MIIVWCVRYRRLNGRPSCTDNLAVYRRPSRIDPLRTSLGTTGLVRTATAWFGTVRNRPPPTQHYHYLDAFRRVRGNCKLISGVAQGGRSWIRAVRHVKSSEGIKLAILLLRTELLLVSRSKVRVAFAQLVNGPEDRLPKLGLMRLAVL